MNRRGFIAALAALPFVGRPAKARTITVKKGEKLVTPWIDLKKPSRTLPVGMRVLFVDGSTPETAVPDLYCPRGLVVVVNHIAMVNPHDVRGRWGRPDHGVGLNGAWFPGWRLT